MNKVFHNTLVKFGATWCNPCNQAEKHLKDNYTSDQYESIDVTENEDVARQYGIRNVPTFILFDPSGDILERYTGFDPSQIKNSISKIT